jgi:hypothetical protein
MKPDDGILPEETLPKPIAQVIKTDHGRIIPLLFPNTVRVYII